MTTPVKYTRCLKIGELLKRSANSLQDVDEEIIVNPDVILDRTETCRKLGISRQTLISWIRKGKLKVWKRVGQGTNAALLFERRHVESLCRPAIIGFENKQLPSS